jgi:bifunctional non-homologous end joining protein LigD
MALARYHAKRRFEQTPEPRGKEAAGRGPLRFVVQKHAASRLHYDFRLEAGGVLKSWAVPKGPSLDPEEKRLAILVEDHPLDYRTFEGTIPAGNYGAGTVMVWDEGVYGVPGTTDRAAVEQAVEEGLHRGQMRLELQGQKLRGRFSLVKLRGKEENAWLLIKRPDAFASAASADDDGARSVLSGRTMAEIAAGVRKPAAGRTGDVSRRVLEDSTGGQAARATRRPRVKPMLAMPVAEPFDRPGWLFEVKWDGFRAIADVRDGEVQLYSRNHKSLADRFPPVVAALANLGHDALLDGEIVAVDAAGEPQFHLLQNYQGTGKGQLVYYVFDLLELDGEDLRRRPLTERKKRLQRILGGSPIVQFSAHIETQGKALFEAAEGRRLEGIIAKNATSTYREGVRAYDWLKIKTQQRQEAVIGGYTEPRGSRSHLGSLVLGVYDGADLIYIGRAGGGFDTRGLADMVARLKPLEQRECPFKVRPTTDTRAHWVAPRLVCEVRFQGWTESGHIRFPIFLGLRDDKDAKQVRREEAKPLPKSGSNAVQADGDRLSPPAAAEPQVQLTNLKKIYWPDDGYTKGDLIEYYRGVAEVLLPHLKDRPMSLNRHPNGIKGKSFYQKDVSRQPPPEWVQTAVIMSEAEGRTIRYALCQNAASLLYLANLGCIEMNPWLSRVASPSRPDFLVIDLDPEATTFARVVEAAQAVRKTLDKAGVEGYCKTSGKTGLHIYVPLAAQYDYDQARQFTEIVMNLVHRQLPETTSVLRRPALRQGKVYLDFLQNRRGQTLASAYSVRPEPGATVSTPLKWSEVTKRLDPARFTIRTVRKRLDKLGDLWLPVLGEGIDLLACLERLRDPTS